MARGTHVTAHSKYNSITTPSCSHAQLLTRLTPVANLQGFTAFRRSGRVLYRKRSRPSAGGKEGVAAQGVAARKDAADAQDAEDDLRALASVRDLA